MNERLGALLPPGVDVGRDMPALSTAWISDLFTLYALEEEEDEESGYDDEDEADDYEE